VSDPAIVSAFASLPAHGVGTRQDLPLPFTAVLIGAAVALLVSFVALSALWPEPRLRADSGLPLPSPLARVLSSPVFKGVWVTLAALLTAWTLMALVFGKDDANNPVPYVVYVWLWVGLAALSLIFGPVWAWLNLIAPDRTTLLVLRVAIGSFVLIDLLGALVFGRGWFARADPFEVWSRLYGSLSPLARRPDRVWVLRSPLHGANAVPLDRGLLATAAVMLGGTAYDGFSSEPRWFTFVQESELPSELLLTAGLLGMCLVVALSLHLAAAVSARLAGVPVRGLAGQFAPSLLPIAAGYLVAHYWSLFIFEGQNTLIKLSDPLGIGANWLGTAGLTPSAALLEPTLVATIQVVAIVTGHIMGVILAHERAITLFQRRVAVIGQVPLLVLMVGYTCGGLLLLFSS